MPTDSYDYTKPWALFQGEKEPWKDLDRLLEYYEKLDTQKAVGDAFGCTPSTISYWLEKAREQRREERRTAGVLCQRCEDAEVPGGTNAANDICNRCLDELRARDREAPYIDYAEHLETANDSSLSKDTNRPVGGGGQ
jgi:transposase-like protein